ncbi:MAG: leucine-rich repeat domain-containing protein, partial [Atopobiaceae bacterium]|nr:leucine-rich repeat domain-containing protein [Atopobiaceae bacterium]
DTAEPDAAEPVLVAQSDVSGSFVDEASGATWYVRRYEGRGLAITAVDLAEGEGPLDLVVPAGPIVFTTDDGGQAEGTVDTVSEEFYHWGGTNEARERVRSVTIPNTITQIDGRMFGLHMPNLKTVTFEPASEDPEDMEHAGVTTLPDWFFAQSDVENVTLPTNLTAISNSMFYDNRVIKSIVLPPNVEEIEEKAFSNCAALESMTFNEGLRRIGDRAFDHLDTAEHPRLATAELPNSLESIGWRAFSDMDTLTSVSFGTSLTESRLQTIGEAAFENCALSEVRIPDSVTTIGPWAFASNRAKDASGNERYAISGPALLRSREPKDEGGARGDQGAGEHTPGTRAPKREHPRPRLWNGRIRRRRAHALHRPAGRRQALGHDLPWPAGNERGREHVQPERLGHKRGGLGAVGLRHRQRIGAHHGGAQGSALVSDVCGRRVRGAKDDGSL